MSTLFSWIKNTFSASETEDEYYTADEESLVYLRGIIFCLREDSSYIVNGELYQERLYKKIESNMKHRDLKIVLAKYNSTLRNVYTVLKDKPFELCHLSAENRKKVEHILGLFETSVDFSLRDVNGFDISNHQFSFEDLLKETHDKLKKYN